jgi:Bifunctional DNA primase/polymerase, N-terminal
VTAAAPDYHYDTLGQWAAHYAQRGFQVFPLNADKEPLTTNGMTDATSDPATVRDWWARHPKALIGCRVPQNIVILDTDPRHGGLDTWRALIAGNAPMPPTRVHYSGRGDGGAHHWFQRPDAKLSIKALNVWAKAHGTGHAVGKDGKRWVSGIDILSHGHRYTILPPSPHPSNGQPYLWESKLDPAPMPTWLVDILTAPVVTPPTVLSAPALRVVADPTSIADWFTLQASWNDILPAAGWYLVRGNGDDDGSAWRHPNASAAQSATIRHGQLFVYTDNTDFEPTEPESPHGYTRFRAWATLEHNGDMSAAAKAAREMRDGPRIPPVAAAIAPPNVDPETGEIVDNPQPVLGEQFWQSRAYLDHIRNAALSRMVAPTSVLLAVLARASAFVHPSTCLPPIVGDVSPLSMMVALLANSGGGKSASASCARRLLPHVPIGCVANLPLASGEGVIQTYFDDQEASTDDQGKRIKKRTRYGALFILDEGQVLAEIGSRKGATILPTLRSVWSGGDAGQANASAETRRILPGGSYSFGLISLWQDESAALLLADAHGGTPQRFLWASTIDPTITADNPEWPGPLEWEPPPIYAIDGVPQHYPIDIDPAIVREIKEARARVGRGEVEENPLDSHRRLLKLRVAGLLGLLDGRSAINTEDWQLADALLKHSDAVRGWVLSEARRRTADANIGAAKRQAEREAVIEESARDRALRSAAKAAWRVAEKATTAGSKASRRQIMLGIQGRDRKHVTVDEAIDEAVRLDWIAPLGDDLFGPGKARPT